MGLGGSQGAFQVDPGIKLKSFDYTAKEKALIIGREISRSLGIISVVVGVVSLVAGCFFGFFSLVTAYIPMTCFITGLASLTLYGVSAMAFTTAIISGIAYEILDGELKKLNVT